MTPPDPRWHYLTGSYVDFLGLEHMAVTPIGVPTANWIFAHGYPGIGVVFDGHLYVRESRAGGSWLLDVPVAATVDLATADLLAHAERTLTSLAARAGI